MSLKEALAGKIKVTTESVKLAEKHRAQSLSAFSRQELRVIARRKNGYVDSADAHYNICTLRLQSKRLEQQPISLGRTLNIANFVRIKLPSKTNS